MMGKRFYIKKISIIGLILSMALLCTPGRNVLAEEDGKVAIGYTIQDINVIPDKYNTGAKGELTPVGLGQQLGAVRLKAGNGGTMNVLDFVYGNSHISGTVTFENLDFSAYPFTIYHATGVENEIRLVFKNCKFSSVSFEKQESLITSEFENCTFQSFYGSNATFDRCSFGGSYTDGIVPFRNVQVNHCFFSDMTAAIATDKERHIDGTQIYGHAGLDAGNIEFNNCRFEVPNIAKEESTAYVNACIMLQMEYSNADGIRFKDCIVNGGGYSIYARSKSDEYALKNVSFSNIKFGCTAAYGKVYSRLSPAVRLENMQDTDALYIGSVWKEDGKTHFSVTNDTNEERVLLICTDKGMFERTIAACPSGSQLNSEMVYGQFPFDMDVMIPEDCGYAVCFDTTLRGFAEQIRYVNWNGEEVVLEGEAAEALFSGEEEVILSGSCGKEITYTLTNTGVLSFEGMGAMENYHSAKPAPWNAYASKVKEIQIGEGIETVGNQAFRICTAVTKVTLPDTLESIGRYAFGGCSNLLEVTLPDALQSADKDAFSVCTQKIYYNGDNWDPIKSTAEEALWTDRVIFAEAPLPTLTPEPIELPSPTPGPVEKEDGAEPEFTDKSGSEEAPKPTVMPVVTSIVTPAPTELEEILGENKNEITPTTRAIVIVVFLAACAVVIGVFTKNKKTK